MQAVDQPGKEYAHTLMEVAVRRLSEHEGDTTLLNQLQWAAAIKAAAGDDVAHRVRLAREKRTLTWQQIGKALGVSAQAAHQRFRGRGANRPAQQRIEIAVDRKIHTSLEQSPAAASTS